jgi:hypothetical protein
VAVASGDEVRCSFGADVETAGFTAAPAAAVVEYEVVVKYVAVGTPDKLGTEEEFANTAADVSGIFDSDAVLVENFNSGSSCC